MEREEADVSVRETPFGEFLEAIEDLSPQDEKHVTRIVRAIVQLTAAEHLRHTAAALVMLTHEVLIESKRSGIPWVC